MTVKPSLRVDSRDWGLAVRLQGNFRGFCLYVWVGPVRLYAGIPLQILGFTGPPGRHRELWRRSLSWHGHTLRVYAEYAARLWGLGPTICNYRLGNVYSDLLLGPLQIHVDYIEKETA